MDAVLGSRFSKVTGVAGSLISVVLVFGGSSVRADGLTGLTSPSDGSVGLVGAFSEADLAGLEQASVDQALTTRLAEVDEMSGAIGRQTQARPIVPGNAATLAATDLLPYSERLMPLLSVTGGDVPVRPSVGGKLRPGAVQPVGVSVSSLRSPTPTEKRTVR